MTRDLLGNNTRWAAASEVLQLISSTLVVLMVARLLDETSYGVLGGVAALAAIALNLSNLGSHILLLRRGAQGEDLGEAWSRAITVGVGLPGLLAVLLLVSKPFFQPAVDFEVYALFIVAGMPLFWLSELAVYLPVGLGDMKRATVGRLIVTVCRLGAIGWFAMAGTQNLTTWAWANMVSFALSAVLGIGYIWFTYGVKPRFSRRAHEDLGPGLP
ncbi:MAG: oligosaccharide flippase family protein, partial [Acidimicrobiia bacterium]|nr:oligosaccharide flippase family protein [Acidimicrobiia bacterium]